MFVVFYTQKTIRSAVSREFQSLDAAQSFIDVLLELGFFVSFVKKGGDPNEK